MTGCLGDGATDADRVDPPDDETRDGTANNETRDAERLGYVEDVDPEPLRFPLERPVTAERWINGSFEADETGIGGGFVTGAFVKSLDLSDLIPVDVPTRVQVNVTLDTQEVPFVGPTGRADPTSNNTLWYESTWENPEPGRFEAAGVLKRSEDGTYGIQLEAYAPGLAQPPQMEYSVHARTTAHPERLPDGVPVALRLEGNETITFDAPDNDTVELLIYSPGDTLVDRLYFMDREHWRVPRGKTGEFVVMPMVGSGELTIGRWNTTNDADGTMRALGFHREEGEPHDVVGADTVQWTFEVKSRPLRAKLVLSGPPGEPWACNGIVSVRLESPEDTVLERSVDCPSPTNAPFLFEEKWTWTTPMGDARLVPGTYQASVEADLWYGHRAYHVVEWYER